MKQCPGSGWSVLFMPLSAAKATSFDATHNMAEVACTAARLRQAAASLCHTSRIFSRCLRRRPGNAACRTAVRTINTNHMSYGPCPVRLPEDLLRTGVLPFLTAPTLLHVAGVASQSMRRSTESALCDWRRKEWLLLHITDSTAFLRHAHNLHTCCGLRLPFPGCFTHASCCKDLSLFFISSSATDQCLLWVVRVERLPHTLALRLPFPGCFTHAS